MTYLIRIGDMYFHDLGKQPISIFWDGILEFDRVGGGVALRQRASE